MVNLGAHAQIKANKFVLNQPNINVKLVDKILRGEPVRKHSFISADKNNKKPSKKTITVKERLNNILYNNSTASQLNKYYMEANIDIVRKIMSEKFKKNPLTLLNKSKREQQKQLQETTKEFVNSFENLSNQYFKKVGDEYFKSEFSELISENAIKELTKNLVSKQVIDLALNNHVEVNATSSIFSPSKQGNNSPKRLFSTKKPLIEIPIPKEVKEEQSDHPLSSIKSQIGNIEEFIKSLLESDRDIDTRKSEILKLEEDKKNAQVDCMKLKEEIVACIYAD